MNIALVGFMGTGKTQVGKLIADRLGMRFVEMDAVIENREDMTITDIFKIKGESYFRKLEEELITELMEEEGQVLSCGGGVVINPKNIEKLKNNSFLVCLNAEPKEIYDRTKNNDSRPLLQVEDPLMRIKDILKSRKIFYDKIKVQIDTNNKTVQQVAGEIISLITSEKGKQ